MCEKRVVCLRCLLRKTSVDDAQGGAVVVVVDGEEKHDAKGGGWFNGHGRAIFPHDERFELW